MGLMLLPEVGQTIATSVSAFCASNLDDIVLLMLFFSPRGDQRRGVHVVAGQYLGFSLLVLASLVGYLGGQILPTPWIGLLGLLPISLGVSQLIDSLDSVADPADGDALEGPPVMPSSLPSWLGRWAVPAAEVGAIAAITVANGGDNVGLYLPLFARCSTPQLLLTLGVFFVMVGLWCGLAWRLVQVPRLADVLRQYGAQVVPFVLIGLGVLILMDSHTLQHRGLATLALACIGVMALSLLQQLSQTVRPALLPLLSRSR